MSGEERVKAIIARDAAPNDDLTFLIVQRT
jgi:hypothetical protein